jgi:hypothetical protein
LAGLDGEGEFPLALLRKASGNYPAPTTPSWSIGKTRP